MPSATSLALRPGASAAAPVVLSAHLDTVFPAETPIAVRRDGDLMEAPGISDDGRGLAVLLAVARALDAGAITTRAPILFAATVGEEGVGDLRGAKHLVGPSGAGRGAAAFISIDGAGLDRVVAHGLGSRRFRLRVRGPGRALLARLGTGEPDPRAGEGGGLDGGPPPPYRPAHDADRRALGRRHEHQRHRPGGLGGGGLPERLGRPPGAHRGGGAGRGASRDRGGERPGAERGVLEAHVETIGVRPAGTTDPDAGLVRAARLATEAVGVDPILALSSTDANAAMAAGIPAVTLGGGGEAGGAHTTAEWYRNVRGVEGVARALYTVVLSAGMAS